MSPEEFLTDDNCWFQSRVSRVPGEKAGILFLDRDGVIVEEVGYLHKIEDVVFIQEAIDVVVNARASGLRVAMVTNQAGIGRGYYSWYDFSQVNDYILGYLDSRGARIDCVVAAPHHPQGIGEFRCENHVMRKPNAGMLEAAYLLLNGDRSKSVIVGDNITDILAGKAFGLPKGFLVLTGHGRAHADQAREIGSKTFEVEVLKALNTQIISGVAAQ